MKYIKYFLIFLALLIVAVIAINYINSKPKKARQNPYAFNVDEFRNVDPDLISHSEVRQIRVAMGKTGGIATWEGNIYLAVGNSVKTLTPQGSVLSEFSINPNPRCIAVIGNLIAIGYENYFSVHAITGEMKYQSEVLTDSTLITSIALWDDKVVVADAGKRRVYLYSETEKVSEIEGVSGARNLHGFIIPSARFDLGINTDNELWVVNPGMHALQHYDARGNLTEAWDKASLSIEGFSGCCNPAQITFLNDGRIVTSEKGMPRIKIYSKGGVLQSVVAAPDLFAIEGEAPDVATIDETIVALDYDKKMIRIFEKKHE